MFSQIIERIASKINLALVCHWFGHEFSAASPAETKLLERLSLSPLLPCSRCGRENTAEKNSN